MLRSNPRIAVAVPLVASADDGGISFAAFDSDLLSALSAVPCAAAAASLAVWSVPLPPMPAGSVSVRVVPVREAHCDRAGARVDRYLDYGVIGAAHRRLRGSGGLSGATGPVDHIGEQGRPSAAVAASVRPRRPHGPKSACRRCSR